MGSGVPPGVPLGGSGPASQAPRPIQPQPFGCGCIVCGLPGWRWWGFLVSWGRWIKYFGIIMHYCVLFQGVLQAFSLLACHA